MIYIYIYIGELERRQGGCARGWEEVWRSAVRVGTYDDDGTAAWRRQHAYLLAQVLLYIYIYYV